VERIERGVGSKLTLVSAPAGFGKTTLLAEWLALRPPETRRVAWLSLDRSDDEAAQIWTDVIAAHQSV
jgi:LuxR family maltose regulon positive regulatory protein